MHSNEPLGRLEWIELGIFVLLLVVVISLLSHCCRRRALIRPSIKQVSTWRSWRNFPESRLLMLALPLELLWEISQFPLYTVWHEGSWSYILYGLVHCTLGDLLILLSVYWLVALLNQDRHWYLHTVLPNGFLFTTLGVFYTIYSEIVNVRLKGTWGYTELMPVVPVIEVGAMPLLQWILIPPVLLWLMRLLKIQHTI